jgi:hypothetical protein
MRGDYVILRYCDELHKSELVILWTWDGSLSDKLVILESLDESLRANRSFHGPVMGC